MWELGASNARDGAILVGRHTVAVAVAIANH
jgi:hypothetical protein